MSDNESLGLLPDGDHNNSLPGNLNDDFMDHDASEFFDMDLNPNDMNQNNPSLDINMDNTLDDAHTSPPVNGNNSDSVDGITNTLDEGHGIDQSDTGNADDHNNDNINDENIQDRPEDNEDELFESEKEPKPSNTDDDATDKVQNSDTQIENDIKDEAEPDKGEQVHEGALSPEDGEPAEESHQSPNLKNDDIGDTQISNDPKDAQPPSDAVPAGENPEKEKILQPNELEKDESSTEKHDQPQKEQDPADMDIVDEEKDGHDSHDFLNQEFSELEPADHDMKHTLASDEHSEKKDITQNNKFEEDNGFTKDDPPQSAGQSSTDATANDHSSPERAITPHDDEDEDTSRRSAPRITEEEPEIKSEPAAPAIEEYPSDSETDEKLKASVSANSMKLAADLDANDKTRVRQTHAIIIPSYASWFNMKKVHKIERDSLPEFFTSSHPSKSPKIYANYRNFMINAYRLNPNEYLTLTSCRRNLVGDVGTLMRVHRFLTKWGLINYQVNPLFKPAYALEKLPNESLVGLPYTGDFHVQYDTPRGLFPFDTYKVTPENINAEKLKSLLDSSNNNDFASKTADPAIKENKDNEGEEPPSKKQKLADDWSAKDLASLILAIREHKNDWYKIAKQVGNGKTPQDCILKFLGLPIEDRFSQLSEKDLGIIKYAPNFPLTSVDNPVIGNLIFMTNLVDSDVVKAAVSRASKITDDELLNKVEKVYGKKDDSEESKKSPSVDKNGATNEEDDNIDDELKKEFAGSEHVGKTPIEEAATGVFGALGARSHLFATYEERELQQLTTSILDREMKKLDVKLKKINELEKIFQRERQNLAKLQNEVFVDRLSLTKSTINISKKLKGAVLLLQGAEGDESEKPDLQKVSSLLEEAQGLLYKPSKQSLNESNKAEDSERHAEENEALQASADAVVKPVSVETPQLFKVWAP